MSTPGILIVYGTSHGQTAKIAEQIRQTLEEDGFRVTSVNAKEERVPDPGAFQGVIIGASIIARGHQPAVAKFIRTHVAQLNAMPCAFFSVSASAGSAREAGRAAARRVRDEFLAEVGLQPALRESVAGAIAYTRYNPLLRWYMKRASKMNGGSTDTSRDHEYTDWNQVRNFAMSFGDLFILREPVIGDLERHSVHLPMPTPA
jgi:menaquinone-dependent protoporphyrinogen oxidase